VQPWYDSIGIARSTQPSPESLSALTGIPWLSFAVLVGGMVVAAVVPRDRWSFGIAVAASVLGSPALYHAGYVPLLALAVPLAEGLRERRPAPTPLGHVGTRGDLPRGTMSGHDTDQPIDAADGAQP
jgi:hypothetical protein